MRRACLLLAWVLVAGGARAEPAAPATGSFGELDLAAALQGEVRVEAGRLEAVDGGRRLLLTGGVRLEGRAVQAQAEWVEVWADEERIVLAGGVRVVRHGSVLLAERLEIDRQAARALLLNGTVWVKERAAHGTLGACRTASELRTRGKNTFALEGLRWHKAGGRWRLEQASLSACDCGPDEAPTWQLRAVEADVIPDERAWLRWPVLVLKGLPAFALPLVYLPLGERRTGLLMPELNYSSRDGLVLSESLFVTLGEHADTTLSLDWFQDRGFRERLELRAIPWPRSWLKLRLMHTSDAKAAAEAEAGRRVGRQRASGELVAWADLPHRLDVRLTARLYSDSDIHRDFLSDLARRAQDMAVSGLSLSHRGAHFLVALEAGWVQDLRFQAVPLFALAGEALVTRLGMDPVGDTIQRLGVVRFELLPWRPAPAWPLLLSASVELANLSSLQDAWRDWGPDGTPDPLEPRYAGAPVGDRGADGSPGEGSSGPEGDGRLGPGELRRAVRLRLEPGLRAPFRPIDGLLLEGRLSHRQLVYLPHGPDAPEPSTRGVTFVGLGASAEWQRGFGDAPTRLGHLLKPSLEVVGAWRGLASRAPPAFLDLEDRLASDAAQLVLGFETALFGQRGAGFQRLVELEVNQAFDLRDPGLAQASVGLGLEAGPARARALAILDWRALGLAEVDAWLQLRDARGDSLQASYLYLPSTADAAGRPLPLSERTQREPGLLFGLEPEPRRGLGDGLHVLQLDGRLALFFGLWLTGSLHLNLRAVEVTWYGGGLGYRSDCGCFAFSVSARKVVGQGFPDLFFFLDLGYLGTAGGGTSTLF